MSNTPNQIAEKLWQQLLSRGEDFAVKQEGSHKISVEPFEDRNCGLGRRPNFFSTLSRK